jgi:hypothetical protein
MDYQDEFAGQGGSYLVDKNGKRIRVEETRNHPQGNCAREAEPDPFAALSAPVTTTQPAEV